MQGGIKEHNQAIKNKLISRNQFNRLIKNRLTSKNRAIDWNKLNRLIDSEKID